jgi:hypothetical protein
MSQGDAEKNRTVRSQQAAQQGEAWTHGSKPTSSSNNRA